MQTTTTTGTATEATKVTRSAARLDLDALAKRDVHELGKLYAQGATPTRIDALTGHPQGRMLAVRALDHGFAGGTLRAIAGSARFPWGGKSFAGAGERGTGINRVHLGGRHQLFPFLTRIQPSAIDGAPCIALDYDLPDNPWLIRSIHDEVREVAPGLYLGPAMWKGAAGPALVLWFALDTRVQAKAIGEKGDA